MPLSCGGRRVRERQAASEAKLRKPSSLFSLHCKPLLFFFFKLTRSLIFSCVRWGCFLGVVRGPSMGTRARPELVPNGEVKPQALRSRVKIISVSHRRQSPSPWSAPPYPWSSSPRSPWSSLLNVGLPPQYIDRWSSWPRYPWSSLLNVGSPPQYIVAGDHLPFSHLRACWLVTQN